LKNLKYLRTDRDCFLNRKWLQLQEVKNEKQLS
jgi:hypothetical protein